MERSTWRAATLYESIRRESMKNKRDRAYRQQGKPSPASQPASSGAATVDVLFERARAHHGAGRLGEAEAMYREILEASPNHADALHLLGVLGYQEIGRAPSELQSLRH